MMSGTTNDITMQTLGYRKHTIIFPCAQYETVDINNALRKPSVTKVVKDHFKLLNSLNYI